MNAWNQPLKIPVTALFLVGMCPVLAGCDTFFDALLLSAASVIVAALTAVILYLLRGVVSGWARWTVLLITSSALAAIAALLAEAYSPTQYASVGLYLPLTALQAVFLDRVLSGQDLTKAARTWARPVGWYVGTLCALGLLREFLGVGTLFGVPILPSDMEAMAMFHSAPGAFLGLALLLMCANAYGLSLDESGEEAQS